MKRSFKQPLLAAVAKNTAICRELQHKPFVYMITHLLDKDTNTCLLVRKSRGVRSQSLQSGYGSESRITPALEFPYD